MSDIVERLDGLYNNEMQWENVWEIAEDAVTEITRLRAENETLRRDVRTAVMGDSAELQDVKRENEKLRAALKPFGEALKDNYFYQVDELPIIAGSNQMDIRFNWTLGDLRAAAAAIHESEE